MSGKRAKRLRRESREKGEEPKITVYTQPVTFTVKGKEAYIPRRQRRALMRQFLTGLKKGRINLNDRQEQR